MYQFQQQTSLLIIVIIIISLNFTKILILQKYISEIVPCYHSASTRILTRQAWPESLDWDRLGFPLAYNVDHIMLYSLQLFA